VEPVTANIGGMLLLEHARGSSIDVQPAPTMEGYRVRAGGCPLGGHVRSAQSVALRCRYALCFKSTSISRSRYIAQDQGLISRRLDLVVYGHQRARFAIVDLAAL